MSRSIIQDEEGTCYICSHYCGDRSFKRGLEKHHIFGGPLRKKSEHYGLWVTLCRKHHTGDIDGSGSAVHRPDRNDYSLRLKYTAQKRFERHYGIKEFRKAYKGGDWKEHLEEVDRMGHALFMQEFGRNWT